MSKTVCNVAQEAALSKQKLEAWSSMYNFYGTIRNIYIQLQIFNKKKRSHWFSTHNFMHVHEGFLIAISGLIGLFMRPVANETSVLSSHNI